MINFYKEFPILREQTYNSFNKFYIFDSNKWSVPFLAKNSFTKNEIDKAFEFAFNSKDKHRCHRTGGSLMRNSFSIFFNIFIGKLGEIAVFNNFKNNGIQLATNDIDFNIKEIGDWDSCDLVTKNNKKISIKASKHYSQMMLLEKNDYNNLGELKYNIGKKDKISKFDYFSYVRVAPYKNGKINFLAYGVNPNNEFEIEQRIKKYGEKQVLSEIIKSCEWKYEESFIVKHDLLLELINKNIYVKRGNYIKFERDISINPLVQLARSKHYNDRWAYICKAWKYNGFKLDTDNYYFPLKYMNRIKDYEY